MKKYFKYIAIALSALTCNSCQPDFLDLSDPDSFDITKYYQSEQDMTDALSAAYSAMRIPYDYMFFVTEMKSDNASTVDAGSSGGQYYTFVSHQVTSSNAIVGYIYNGLYNCIYKANLVLKYIDNVKMSDEKRESLICQAKYLRALAHFYLVRLWGPVTVMDKVLESTSETLEVKRNSTEEVYALIVSDLTAVANSSALPSTYDASNENYGRITNTAGAALLGKVYLTMAATLDNDSYYTKAITFLEKACTLAGFTNLSTTAYNTLFTIASETDPELIFQCMYMGTSTECSSFAWNFQPYGATGLTSNYIGRGWNTGQQNLYDEFESTANGFDKTDRRIATAIVKYTDGSYYTKKYVDKTSDAGYGGNNWIELRFADVFLMLAEAYERTEGNTSANAIGYLNKVRLRKGSTIDAYETAMNNATYATAYPTLRDAIFHERRIELCFENQRWFDLQRLYPNAKDFATYMQSVTEPNASGKYTDFKAYETLLPIPYDECFLNKNIYQNNGY